MPLEILREMFLLCAPKGKYTANIGESICFGLYPILSPSFFTFNRSSDFGWNPTFTYEALNRMPVEAALDPVNKYNVELRAVFESETGEKRSSDRMRKAESEKYLCSSYVYVS